MAVAEREEAPAVNWSRPRFAPGKSAGIPYPLCSIPRHVSGDLDHITARMTHDRSHDGQPVHTFLALPLAASPPTYSFSSCLCVTHFPSMIHLCIRTLMDRPRLLHLLVCRLASALLQLCFTTTCLSFSQFHPELGVENITCPRLPETLPSQVERIDARCVRC